MFLLEQLKEYEANIPMSRSERKELHDWVTRGRSPYDNGNYICGSSGIPLDFISALRAEQELQDWSESTPVEEIEAENRALCYQYSAENDEFYFDATALWLPDVEECELPFQ